MAQGSNDFDALARQYWGMWGDALRAFAPQADAGAGMQGFRDALAAWTGAASGGPGGFDAVLGHFNRQNGDWLARMQQVAAQFAGRPHEARDVVEAWKRALGGNPFQGLVQGMDGPGLEGPGRWSELAAPWLQGVRGEAMAMLGLPAFGFTREHQERLQALARAQLRWQEALGAWNALMARVSQEAYEGFEARLAGHDAPGKQVESVRALFDLWVEAAEEAYAKAALSEAYRHAYGELVNAQMELRARAQAIAEHTANLLGLPTRTELDSAHRKIAELERSLRRMQRAASDGMPVAVEAKPSPAPRRGKPAATKARAAKATAGGASARPGKAAGMPAKTLAKGKAGRT